MKKTGIIITLVICILCSSFSFAEEKEILFRGLEWGIPYEETLKAFDKDFPFTESEPFDFWRMPTDLLKTTDYRSYREYLGTSVGSSVKYYESFEVAGYPVRSVNMYYAYLPGEDGILVRDHEHTSFYLGFYEILPKDYYTAFEDLTTKMNTLYGDMDYENIEDGSSFINNTFRVWNGKNGTMVGLELEEYNASDTKYLYIRYTFQGADELIEQAHQAVLLEERINAESNYDGL